MPGIARFVDLLQTQEKVIGVAGTDQQELVLPSMHTRVEADVILHRGAGSTEVGRRRDLVPGPLNVAARRKAHAAQRGVLVVVVVQGDRLQNDVEPLAVA